MINTVDQWMKLSITVALSAIALGCSNGDRTQATPTPTPSAIASTPPSPTTGKNQTCELTTAPASETCAVAQATPLPEAAIVADGTQLRIQSPGGTQTINVANLNVELVNALDCANSQTVERKVFSGERFVRDTVAIDPNTGNIAVGVLLQECIETQFSAVFIIQPQGESYTATPVQVPSQRPLPSNISSNWLNSLSDVGYFDGSLLVTHSDASGSKALIVFKPSTTAVPVFAGCVHLDQGESNLCGRYQTQ